MDTQQNTALARALAEVPGPLPSSGVIHIAIPHTSRFTVVGNDLAQHPGLSSTAVGLAVRIQSLPRGAEVGIKALAARFPEGEKRIAAALRELEAHGYLQRDRTRLASGRIVTRTVFCNQPAALLRPRAAGPSTASAPSVRPVASVASVPAAPAVPPPAAAPAPTPQSPVTVVPTPAPATPVATDTATATAVPEQRTPQTPVTPVPLVPVVPPPTASRPAPRPLPQPRQLTPDLQRAAAALLSDLRRHAPQFVLSESDVSHLVPGVAAWLERDARPDAIRHALTDDPPHPLRHPAKLVKHRLTALLPPPLPLAHDLAAPARRVTVTPFQTCEGCDRAFRSTAPGHCRDCRTASARTAA
ncbi:hypothetical protein EES43_11290 [Streptomyces sp. ADI96-02]|uniref:hypothetical protein n=1 Tax=Streptomyces sp. ADI96-02 TaxID=1522760 RepID=UPI000F55014E|nr:hypothetical protein [Streptomyces sp. ADI96-02]RPK63592.1 hypothetical protein EES43_11290 [Streptomyces sp. ADI96-02]